MPSCKIYHTVRSCLHLNMEALTVEIKLVPCLFSINTSLFHDSELSSPTNKRYVTTLSNNLKFKQKYHQEKGVGTTNE